MTNFALDNEPMLWNSTHRDVHPDPVTYDELLDRTIRYGSAVRAADPDAVTDYEPGAGAGSHGGHPADGPRAPALSLACSK